MVSPEASAERGGRRRGRPRRRGSELSGRDAILAAAEEEFSEVGFEAASIRSIARRAGVDPALVHHYFSDKSELVVGVLKLPVNPAHLLSEALSGPLEGMGERAVRAFLSAWDDPLIRRRALVVLRSALGAGAISGVVRSFFFSELVDRIAKTLGGGEEAKLRAGLAASRMIGLVVARYGLRIPAVSQMSREDAVAVTAPAIQEALTGPLPPLDGLSADRA